MFKRYLKPWMPRSLIGRAFAILVVPAMGILILVSIGVIQRHYDRVTRQLTVELGRTITHLQDRLQQDPQRSGEVLAELALAFELDASLEPPPVVPVGQPHLPLWELSARLARRELLSAFPEAIGLRVTPEGVVLQLPARIDATQGAPALRISMPLSRLTASNPHQLLVITIGAAILMTLIAFQFLRIQLRPISRLAQAAEAFGRGEAVPLRVSGATEVRAAGRAFLEMRNRIEAQIEQRTLMLSGVSHDLRTPLTRARLALSMMDGEPEAEAVRQDLAQMETLIDRYLDFLRDGAAEPEVACDLTEVVAESVARVARGGGAVLMRPPGGHKLPVRLRPALFQRALDNLIGNALRYGQRAEVWIEEVAEGLAVCVEDAGPGIPPERREEALRPFTRLDPSRAADGGVGLGLAIAADAMRSHGGRIDLGQGCSPGLGGLMARMVLPAPDSASTPQKASQISSAIQTGV